MLSLINEIVNYSNEGVNSYLRGRLVIAISSRQVAGTGIPSQLVNPH